MKSETSCSNTAARGALLTSLLGLVLGCAPDSARLSDADVTATGAPASRAIQGEDGLLIGHNLMAAEEFELALKAYYSAAAQLGLTADVMSAIGSANLGLGRVGQAETNFRAAIDIDERFVPAWNNLGIVLYQQGKLGEAREAMKVAFALDSGQSREIRDNLRLLDAKLQEVEPEPSPADEFRLVRRGNGRYLLLGN